MRSHKKIGPDRFSRLTYIGYKQTDKKSINIYIFMYFEFKILKLRRLNTDR